MKKFYIGNKIQSFDSEGNLVAGEVAKVSKTTYTLKSGIVVDKEHAVEMKTEYWEEIAAIRLRKALISSIKGVNLSKAKDKALEKVFIALFDKKTFLELEAEIKQQVGL